MNQLEDSSLRSQNLHESQSMNDVEELTSYDDVEE